MKFCCTVIKDSTAILHSAIGYFTTETCLNLLVAKNSLVEVYKYSECQLSPLLEIPIFGKIDTIQLFSNTNSGSSKESLLIFTNRLNFIIIECHEENDEFKICTVAHGTFPDCLQLKKSMSPPVIDPTGSFIAFQLNSHVIKIISVDHCGLSFNSTKNIHVDEQSILSYAFVKSSEPNLVILYNNGFHKFFSIHEICSHKYQCSTSSLGYEKISNSVNKIHPLTNSKDSFILYGSNTVVYVSQGHTVSRTSASLGDSSITCCCTVGKDESRFVLGDFNGLLHYIILVRTDSKVTDIHFGTLGKITIPSTLVHLGNGVIFVGSRYGDSQIVQLVSNGNQSGGWVKLLSHIPNIGPIVDMTLASKDRTDHRVITCSGYGKAGSLNVLHRAVGYSSFLTIHCPLINYIAPLSIHEDFDDYVLISSDDSSHIIKITAKDVAKVEFDWLNTSVYTLYCKNISHNHILLINELEVLIVETMSCSVKRWSPNIPISVVSSDTTRILCSSASSVYYLTLNNGEIQLIDSHIFNGEVSALCLAGDIFFVSFWNDCGIYVYRISQFELISSVVVDQEFASILSLVLLSSWNSQRLLCSTLDGHIFHLQYDTITELLRYPHERVLSQSSISLCKIMAEGDYVVIACSSSSAEIRFSNDNLMIWPVNPSKMQYIVNYNSPHFQDCHLISDGEYLIVGKFEVGQRIYCKHIPLSVTPRRIKYCPQNNLILVATSALDILKRGSRFYTNSHDSFPLAQDSSISPNFTESSPISSLSALDGDTYEVLYSRQFGLHITSVVVLKFPCGILYGVALTGGEDYALDFEYGKIVIFKWESGELSISHEINVEGMPYCLQQYRNMVVVSINGRIELFSVSQCGITLVSSLNMFVSCNVLKVCEDLILVGDFLESVALLRFDEASSSLVEVNRDFSVRTIVSIEFVRDNLFLAFDSRNNLILYENKPETDRLNILSCYYLADSLNIMISGYLTKFYDDSKIIFGTLSGCVGSIKSIEEESLADFYTAVQSSVLSTISNVGNIYYEKFRKEYCEFPKYYSYPYKSSDFIDGNVLLSVLGMSSKDLTNVVRKMEEKFDMIVTPSELVERIEHFSLNC